MQKIPLWLGVLTAIVLVGAAAATSSLRKDRTFAREVTAKVNQTRAEQGLTPLRVSYQLRGAAAARAVDLAERGYFGHRSPDGEPFWREVRQFYPSGEYRFWSVGENLYWSANARPPAAHVIARWLASPGHRMNLLAGKWREIGITVVRAPHAPGVYAGRPVVIVTAEFGVRRR